MVPWATMDRTTNLCGLDGLDGLDGLGRLGIVWIAEIACRIVMDPVVSRSCFSDFWGQVVGLLSRGKIHDQIPKTCVPNGHSWTSDTDLKVAGQQKCYSLCCTSGRSWPRPSKLT